MSRGGGWRAGGAGPLFRRRILPAALLALLAAALYARTLGNGLVYDDDYIFKNPQVADGVTLRDAAWAFTTAPDRNWMPLTWLTHLAAVAAFGAQPAGHHLIQVLLHAANAALLFLVLRGATGAAGRSLAAALLFAVHPLHVESVAWVAERKDVLSTLFGLLSLGAYVGYTRRPSAGRYLAAAGWLAAGLMAKPMLVTLPLVFLLLDWWPLGRFARGAGRRALAEKAPLFALALAAGLVALATQRSGGALGSLLLYPAGERVANALLSVVAYLGDLVVPAGLAAFYPHPGASVSRGLAAAAGLGLAVATALLALARRERPFLLAGWLWFLVTLLPVAGLVQVGEQARADRYAYVPFIGLYVLLAWGLAAAADGRPVARRALPAASAVVIAVLAALAVRQQGFWKDNVTLFRHAVAETRGNWVAHYNLGISLAGQGRKEESVAQLAEAVRIQPGIPRYRYDLGRMLALSGRYPEAEEQYRQSLALAPADPAVLRDLGAVLKAQGRREEAERELLAALRLDPLDERAQRHLAQLRGAGAGEDLNDRAVDLEEAGRLDEAEQTYREALRLSPGAVNASYNFGLLLARRGRGREAEALFRAALERHPRSAELHHGLGRVLGMAGDRGASAREFEAALALQPGFEPARRDLETIRGAAPR